MFMGGVDLWRGVGGRGGESRGVGGGKMAPFFYDGATPVDAVCRELKRSSSVAKLHR